MLSAINELNRLIKLAKKKEVAKETKKTGVKKTKKVEQTVSHYQLGGVKGSRAVAFESIVRILRTTLDGSKPVKMALIGIKGIGYNLSVAICRTVDIDENKILKELSEEDIKKIEDVVENADKHMPAWMLNRQKDYETGETTHIFGPQMTIKLRDDISRLRKIRAYRGIRHELGLPTRGQRTKNSFRKHSVVGVAKKK